jgi:RNA ligase (TIGR02306 family)
LVTVLGWNVVVAKSENHKVLDKIIYLEIDSVCPEAIWSEFLRPRKFRVKSIKLRGCLSQGLILPLSILSGLEELPIDTDVTEQLGIKKYEPPLPKSGGPNMGKAKGNFPSFINKTDETRIQSKKKVIEELKLAGPFYIGVKVDGTSSTFCYDGDEFCACSRNWKKTEDDENIYWEMARKYKLADILKGTSLGIQGEIVGPKIQKNRLGLAETDLLVFDLYNINSGRYLSLYEMINFCKDNGLQTVPIEMIVDSGFDEFDYSLSAWLKRAEGLYIGTNQQREGIVVRPVTPTYSQVLQGRLSFKVINNLYLLSGGE